MRLPPVYPIVDTASVEIRAIEISATEAAEAFLEGGAQILQLRHKGFWSREVFDEAKLIAYLCSQASVPFIVNDRADYAALLNAGLHIGQDDLSPADARNVLGNERTLGFSTHNSVQMSAAQGEPIDYVAFGPVFSTRSKERPDPTAGLESLAAVRALTQLPLVAIGGITRENASACWRAGADSVAVIADLLPKPCTKQDLRARMAEWRQLK